MISLPVPIERAIVCPCDGYANGLLYLIIIIHATTWRRKHTLAIRRRR
jgi:hypothetical protein